MKQQLLSKALLLFVLLLGLPGLGMSQQVFINEIHYDNASTDVNEGIEIAGPAGTDLTGWTLVAYNGNGGALYNTVNLSGVLADQQAGFGTAFFAIPSLQNGGPDGVALVNAADSVVQFLSYEGSFTAVNGPANGQTSADIGVSEDFNTPAGNSLQLAGEGTSYTDFTWATDTLSTYNQVNAAQTFGTPVPVVFINELHYDNTGGDTGEGVELAGTAGADLTGWTLVAYNGNGGAPYNTISLSGTFGDQANGFGFQFFAIAGLQNGSPDGIALVDADGNVVQFISYEGSFTAVGGAADSLTSEDIGLSEASSTPVGFSLQLTGTGLAYADFTWAAADSSTYNALNNGQTFGQGGGDNGDGGDTTGVATTALWINEFHYDNTSGDVNEGIEVAGPAGTDLSNFKLVLYNGNNGASYNTIALSGTLANQQAGFGTAFFAAPGLQNGSPDGIALATADDTLIQFLSYEGSFAGVGGVADGITSEDVGVSEPGSTTVGFSLQLTGEGNAYEDFNWAEAQANTYDAVNTGQTFVSPVPVLFVNELHYDNAGGDTGEGVEIAGTAGLDLSAYKIVLYNGSNSEFYNTVNLSGTLPDQDNGFGTAFFPIAGLQNGAPDGIALATTEDTLIQFISYEGSFTAVGGVADGVTSEDIGVAETSSTSVGFSLQLTGEGSAYADFTWSGPIANTYDLINTGQSFGGGNNGGGGDTTGTDGVITIAAARATAQGTVVTVEGVLTAADEFAGPAFLQDATGGIAIFDAQLHGPGLFSIGDSVKVTATVSAFNDQIQLSNIDSLSDLGPVSPVTPQTIAVGAITSAVEGELLTVQNVTFTQGGGFFPETNYTVTDSLGNSLEVRIDGNTDVVGRAIPTGPTTVTGVLGSFRGNLQLLPRFQPDVPDAGEFNPGGSDISQDSTFDLSTWNMEFFGTEIRNFGPANVRRQVENATTLITNLNSDIIAVQEVSEERALGLALRGTPYQFTCSQVWSRSFQGPDPNFPPQKLCYIYNTNTVTPVEFRVVFDELYTAARQGLDPTLDDHPGNDGAQSFWSSGRLPYMMVADVTIAGVTERITMVNVHAKSGSGSLDKARREYDVRALKDTLDAFYADANLVVLGDYNDDLDVSIAGGASSYEVLVSDTANYNGVTISLSNAGLKSFLFGSEMIDHQTFSSELDEEFLTGSESLFLPFNLITDFAGTTSDHLPVITRYQFAPVVPVQNLQLTSLCSDNPDSTRRWRVRNANEFDVAYTYRVNGTDQEGAFVAAPGDNFFETITIPNSPNTTLIFWEDETGATKQTVKASGGAPCFIANLQLTSLCSDNPDSTRVWRVRNSNPFAVDYTFEVVGTDQAGAGVAAPGDNFFETVAIADSPNTTIIRWTNESNEPKQTVKASGGAPCFVAPLDLEASCSDDPASTRNFSITNSNPFGVAVTYTFNGMSTGIVAAPGTTDLALAADLNAANSLTIVWKDASSTDVTLTAASIDLPCGTGEGDCGFAAEVVSFNQGTRKNGRAVHRFRSNAHKALGQPMENRLFNFVSLGFGGELVLKMDGPVLDKQGADFVLVETSWGLKFRACWWYPEKAKVYVSKFGVNFTELGVTCRDGFFDLAHADVDWFQYIKIVDVTNKHYFSRNADGFDVDGIICFNKCQAENTRLGMSTFENQELDEVNETSMQLFPNPVIDVLQVQLSLADDEEVTFRLYDVTGNLIMERSQVMYGQEQVSFDLSDLETGAYLLQVSTESGSLQANERVLKQ